jgi:hypothetical protein
VHYLCDTPDGAWAKFLRNEEITNSEDLPTIRCTVWAVDLGEEPARSVALPLEKLTGGPATYAACQEAAQRLRRPGATHLIAPSAALLPGGGRGWRVNGGLQPGSPRDGLVIVLFGHRPDGTGWPAARNGRPDEEMLERVCQKASVGPTNTL